LGARLRDLADPAAENWQGIEAEIMRLWSRSGSDAMDLLLQRGTEAAEAGDWQGAVEHFSALLDHAPEFAEGWHARATAFFMMDEYALALADIERVLALNPRHFAALSGLGAMLEAMGEDALALQAQQAARALHPHRPEVLRATERLEHKIGGADL
jgi:tetratricopeptide (TPR) repeat protein